MKQPDTRPNCIRTGLRIFVSAGELSGDIILAEVIAEIFKITGKLEIKGLSGPYSKELGVQSLLPIEECAVNGISDVIKQAHNLFPLIGRMKKAMLAFNPHLVILVDYPGLNLKLLSLCRKKGLHVYYICPPQYWAYRNRKARIFCDIDVHVQYPMEKASYVKNGARVTQSHFFQKTAASNHKKTLICLCPGSRKFIVQRNLPYYLKVVNSLNKSTIGQFEPAILIPEYLHDFSRALMKSYNIPQLRIFHDKEDIWPRTALAIANPGTITMELALRRIPAIVIGIIDSLTYYLGKLRLKARHLSLPNIITGREFYPEYVFPAWRMPLQSANLADTFETRTPLDEIDWEELIGPDTGAKDAAHNCLSLLDTQICKNL